MFSVAGSTVNHAHDLKLCYLLLHGSVLRPCVHLKLDVAQVTPSRQPEQQARSLDKVDVIVHSVLS